LLLVRVSVILSHMILGLDDIAGGHEILAFLIWLGLTALFYLVGYVAALNVVDDITQNSWLKVPAMWGLSIVTAGLMSILDYNPLILFFVMCVTNHLRLKNLTAPDNENLDRLPINKPLYYIASYGYIFLVLGITHYIDFRNNLQGL